MVSIRRNPYAEEGFYHSANRRNLLLEIQVKAEKTMNNIESLKQSILNLYGLIARGSAALNAEQRSKVHYQEQAVSPLLTYRPTPHTPDWVVQNFRPKTACQCISLITLPFIGLDWNLIGLTVTSIGLSLLIVSWRKQNRINQLKAMAIAIDQIFIDSNETEEIQGVEEEFFYIRQTLEKISQSQNAPAPQEGLEELLTIYNLYIEILQETTNLRKKYQNLEKLEENLETFKNKHREFAPKEALNGISYIQRWVKSNMALLRGKTLFIVASQEKEEEKQLETFYNGCIHLLDIAENYLDFFTAKGRQLTKTMAEALISYKPFSNYASQRPPGEFTSIAIGIRNAAKAILWEVDNYEKTYSEITSVPWKEEEEFMNMLIEDMKNNQNIDAPIEEIEAFDRVLKKLSNEE